MTNDFLSWWSANQAELEEMDACDIAEAAWLAAEASVDDSDPGFYWFNVENWLEDKEITLPDDSIGDIMLMLGFAEMWLKQIFDESKTEYDPATGFKKFWDIAEVDPSLHNLMQRMWHDAIHELDKQLRMEYLL